MEKKRFDYSFLINKAIPSDIINGIININIKKEKNIDRYKNYLTIYKQLEEIAKVESTKASNAIEGIVTSNKGLTNILVKHQKPTTHSEQEIVGYMNSLNLIHNLYETLEFDQSTIKYLHKTMLDIVQDENAGLYKKENNGIFDILPDGTSKLRFMPTLASDVDEAMEQLINAYMIANQNPQINKLLLIPCVILDYLSIHPFMDGNGRTSRLITLLLLYKHGYTAGKYISIDKIINENKSSYYDALKASSINWHDNANDYWPFIKNFIMVLSKCYKQLDDRFLSNGKFNKNNRIEFAILNSLVPLSKDEIKKHVPDASISSIELVLSNLLKEDKIVKFGKTKGVKYFKK